MTDTEEEILGGQFELLPTKKSFFVSLSRKSFTYTKGADECCACVGKHRSATTISTNLVDVYGAKAYRGPEGDPAAYFQVYSCPLSEKKRIRHKSCFKVESSDCEDENIAIAEKWVRTILWLTKEPERNFISIQGKIWWLRSHVKSRVFFLLFSFDLANKTSREGREEGGHSWRCCNKSLHCRSRDSCLSS